MYVEETPQLDFCLTKNGCPPIEENKDSICNARECLESEARVPNVSEKLKRKIDSLEHVAATA